MGIKGKNLLEKLKSDKKLALLLIAAILAVILLFVSELFGGNEKTEIKQQESEENRSAGQYEKTLESKLEDIISSIQGAGKTKVMITIDTGEETVYAKQGKNSSETSDGKEKDEDEYEYVIIKSGSSSEEGLLVKVIEPNVRGVAVVCEGGDNAGVRESIINTVSAVLNIKSNRISITKLGTAQ